MADVVRIRTTLTSDTPHLPELAPLVGQRVEIVVVPEPVSPGYAVYDTLPAEYPWPTAEQLATREAALAALREGDDYDWDAWRVGREQERRAAEEESRRWQAEQAAENNP